MVGELYRDGSLKTPDKHADVFKQLTDELKSSQVTEVDFSSCGIGQVALGHLSEWVREATAVVNSVTVDANDLFGTIRAWLVRSRSQCEASTRASSRSACASSR